MQKPEKDPGSRNTNYAVEKSPNCQRQFEKMEKQDRRRVEAKLPSLALGPRSFGAEKLRDGRYRLRVGSWRLIYTIDDEAKRVLAVAVRRRNKSTYD